MVNRKSLKCPHNTSFVWNTQCGGESSITSTWCVHILHTTRHAQVGRYILCYMTSWSGLYCCPCQEIALLKKGTLDWRYCLNISLSPFPHLSLPLRYEHCRINTQELGKYLRLPLSGLCVRHLRFPLPCLTDLTIILLLLLFLLPAIYEPILPIPHVASPPLHGNTVLLTVKVPIYCIFNFYFSV